MMWLLFEFYLSTDIDNIKRECQGKKHKFKNLQKNYFVDETQKRIKVNIQTIAPHQSRQISPATAFPKRW